MYLNVNTNQNVNFKFLYYSIGSLKNDSYFWSSSYCVGDCGSRLFFGGDSYGNHYLVSRACLRFIFESLNDSLFCKSVSPVYPDYELFIDNICDLKLCNTKRRVFFNDYTSLLSILGYIGKSVCFGIKCFGSNTYDYFLLKGGVSSLEDSSKIDYFNHGDLFYLGNNPNNLGISLIKFNVDSSFNVVLSTNYFDTDIVYYFDKITGDSLNRCGYYCNFTESLDFIVVVDKNDILSKLQEISDNIKKISLVNEIIVDDNSNVNISKPNYHFEDSDIKGFWGR